MRGAIVPRNNHGAGRVFDPYARLCPRTAGLRSPRVYTPPARALLHQSVLEKMLEVGATFDYRSRSLLEIGLYSFEERSRGLHLEALFYGKFIRGVSKL